MASTGALSIGLSGKGVQTSAHKPSGRGVIILATQSGNTLSNRPNRTGRLALAAWGQVTGVLTPRTPKGRLTFVFVTRATASYIRKPRGKLSIAMAGRSGAPVTVRSPSSRLTFIIATKGTHGLSTRTSATGKVSIPMSARGLRSRTHSKITIFYARPPLQNPHVYAIEQEKLRHNDALTWLGEMTAWILLWSERDFEAGFVDRCSVCYVPLGAIADTYKQVPSQKGCSNCYGTTFEGGVRAIVYRPGLWDQIRSKEEQEKRGLAVVQRAKVNIPSDVEMRDNDIGVRADGSRWRIEQPVNQGLATGFQSVADWSMTVGTTTDAQLLDPTSVAYNIPVDLNFLVTQIGWNPVLPFPAQPPDVLNGPLIVNA